MKPDYKAMEDEELDKLLAVMMGWKELQISDRYELGVHWFKYHFNSKYHYVTHAKGGAVSEVFKPTKDAEQIQKYLFPKLEETKFISIDLYRAGGMFSITIKCLEPMWKVYLDIDSLDPDKINRTIVICILKAWNKIKEAQNDNK